MSFSGKERNHFFLSRGGAGFTDYSFVAGLDAAEDGRTFAYADLDHDGDLDIVLVSRNAPLLQVFRNDLAGENRFLGIEVFGDSVRSNRNAIGARVTVHCGERTITRAVDGGSGFATRNASALTIGLGTCEKPDDLTVQWPSGKTRLFQSATAGRYYEVAEDGPLRELPGFYAHRDEEPPAVAPERAHLLSLLGAAQAHEHGRAHAWHPSGDLVYMTLWASWCAACKREQPRENALAERFAGRIQFAGLNVEKDDTPEIVSAYAADNEIAYPLLSFPLDAHQRVIDEVASVFGGRIPALPAAVVIDRATGRIVFQELGGATVSDLQRLLRDRSAGSVQRGNLEPPVLAAAVFLVMLGVVMVVQRRKRDATPSP